MPTSGQQGQTNAQKRRQARVQQAREKQVQLDKAVDAAQTAINDYVEEVLEAANLSTEAELELLQQFLDSLKQVHSGKTEHSAAFELVQAIKESNFTPYHLRAHKKLAEDDRQPNGTVLMFTPGDGDEHPRLYLADEQGEPILGSEMPRGARNSSARQRQPARQAESDREDDTPTTEVQQPTDEESSTATDQQEDNDTSQSEVSNDSPSSERKPLHERIRRN